MRKAATATQEAQEVLALVEQQQEQLECSTNKVKRIRAVSRAGPYERA